MHAMVSLLRWLMNDHVYSHGMVTQQLSKAGQVQAFCQHDKPMATHHCELVTLPPPVTVPSVDWQKLSVNL